MNQLQVNLSNHLLVCICFTWYLWSGRQINFWTMLGICAQSTEQRSLWEVKGTWGWHNNGEVYLNGRLEKGYGGWRGWEDGDVATLTYDAGKECLSVSLARLPGQTFTLKDIPPLSSDGCYYAFTNICHETSATIVESQARISCSFVYSRRILGP